jgi:hypothetical protein
MRARLGMWSSIRRRVRKVSRDYDIPSIAGNFGILQRLVRKETSKA